MAEEDGEFLRVAVGGLVKDQRNNPVVLLKLEEGDEVLPIWIGHSEALAIELQMRGNSFERPLTHDLMKTAIESLGASVTKVTITGESFCKTGRCSQKPRKASRETRYMRHVP